MIRGSIILGLTFALLTAAFRGLAAQTASVAPPTEWRVWAFGRAGVGNDGGSDARLVSLAGGIAASRGSILGMVRAADTESGGFEDNPPPGVQDYALLAGLRSRGDDLWAAAAVGLAQATDGESRVGRLTPLHRAMATYDLSAHADYLVVGSVLSLSGTLGPADTRYVALTLGVELGWFGR